MARRPGWHFQGRSLSAMLMSRKQHEHAEREWHSDSCLPCCRDANSASAKSINTKVTPTVSCFCARSAIILFTTITRTCVTSICFAL